MSRRRTGKKAAYRSLGAAPTRRSSAWLVVILAALVLVNLYVFVWDKKTGVRAIRQQAEAKSAPTLAIPSLPMATGSATPAAAGSVGPAPAIVGKVGKSDTLGKLLEKHLSAAEADEVIRALSGVLDFRTLRAGQTYRIERGEGGRVARFELDVGKGRRVRAQRQPSGELLGSIVGSGDARPADPS